MSGLREGTADGGVRPVRNAFNPRQIARQTNASRVVTRDRAAITASFRRSLILVSSGPQAMINDCSQSVLLYLVRCTQTLALTFLQAASVCDVSQNVRYEACVIHTQCLIGNNTDGESVVLSSLNSRKGLCEAHPSLAPPPALHFEVNFLHFLQLVCRISTW